MHLDIKNKLEGKISGSLKMHQQIFNVWRKEFNEERPHEAHGMKTPSMVYLKSKRNYDDPVGFIEYPRRFISRRVNDRGYINHKGRRVFITNAIGGYNVGLKLEGKSNCEEWFNTTLLGEINLQSYLFISML